MVALACAANLRFMSSLAEAPLEPAVNEIFYSVDTIARFRREHARAQIFFIIGADSFLEIASWKRSEELLNSCDFIIANRPGVRVEALRDAIPAHMRSARASKDRNSIVLRKSVAHVLTTVSSEISSTDIRARCHHGKSIRGLVPRAVEDYIHKQALYR